jgi:glycosyltransferase involved in cell wall biosynthesis
MSQKIACVIPSYNHADYIAEAIRSVLRQTLPPERLVIVDDGSQDNSVEIIRAVRDPRIQLVVQENQGAHVALTLPAAAPISIKIPTSSWHAPGFD